MPYYPDDIVNDVFAENDIVDFVSQYVRLKRVGRDYSGLCPFHKEKSPSFHVSGEKQLFHCFGCGASGNLVQFVMKIEGLDFVEALKLLAERAGIDLPEGNDQNGDAHVIKKKIYEMNKLAARFFYETLTSHPEGKAALAYFKERQLSKKTIISYGLGFARDSYTALHDYLQKQGYTDKDMLIAGLCVEKDGKIYDKFRNRVIFPIIDLRQNVIGFGGRIMGSGETPSGFKLPKYLNSAETPVFNKGKNLFSLNIAKKNSPKDIILVEGYMDVISLYQAGISNVVATLGTALTENQAKLLLKYCSQIIICYDSDEAGQKAAIRAIDIINAAGGRAKVIKLKGAKDPDEYIKANGAAMFLQTVADASAATQFRLDLLRSEFSLDSPEGKALYVSHAVQALQSITDAVEVDAYINKISKETQVNRDAVYSEYKKLMRQGANSKKGYIKRESGAQSTATVVGDKSQRLINAEKTLIYLMAQNKKYIDAVKNSFNPEDFSTEIHQKLVRIIFEARDNNILIEPSIILNKFSGSDANYVSNIFYNMEEYNDNLAALDELIKNIKIERLSQQLETEHDPLAASKLAVELETLRRNT